MGSQSSLAGQTSAKYSGKKFRSVEFPMLVFTMVLLLRDNRAKGHPGLIIMLEMVVTMMMVLMLFMLMLVAKFKQSRFVMMICSSPLMMIIRLMTSRWSGCSCPPPSSA